MAVILAEVFDQRCRSCAAREDHLHAVADMILRQCPIDEILATVCRGGASGGGDSQLAVFLLEGSEWRLAGQEALAPRVRAVLNRIDPAALSSALLTQEALTNQPGLEIECGWAEHLYSGVGELLGLAVALPDGPDRPPKIGAARMESACRLAVLAIEQSNLVAELSWQATHDPLTGLLNRVRYDRELRVMVGAALRAGRIAALLQVNLDRFRLINDVLGHATGDGVLAEIATRLHASLRPAEVLARTGGDEFSVLLPAVRDPAEAEARAVAMLDILAQPCRIAGHELFVSASFGVATTVPDSTPESLEHQAFIALHHARRQGRRRVVSFHSSMSCAPPERLEMEKRLRTALQRRELQLWYQPQIRLADRRIVGAEALLRWHPEGLGMISPASFISILEETGLIIDVGRWVLTEACQQAVAWASAGRPLRVAVNISAVQVGDGIAEDVERILAETGLPPELLELELTESLFVGDFPSAAKALERLHRAGVRLALDDFGTGQASISYLRELRFHRLKVDHSFVRTIADGEPCPPLVESILSMARTLGMKTIAEGIETEHQLSLLTAAQADEGQGFYFSRAVPPKQFEDFCREYDARNRSARPAMCR